MRTTVIGQRALNGHGAFDRGERGLKGDEAFGCRVCHLCANSAKIIETQPTPGRRLDD